MKQKNKMLIIFSIIIILSQILLTTTCFADTNKETNLNIYAKSCILIEPTTNTIVYEKNSNEKMYPASTTKILTAILTMEKCDLKDIVTITNEMVSKVPAGYTSAYLKPGEQLTIEQLLNALLVPSANDAGFALAIHISGSVENFSILMNEKAKEIGCTNSNFTNPSGIHSENHYSTAKDMALIGLYSLKYPQITSICSQTSYTLEIPQSNTRTFETTNTLLKNTENSYYEYATGLKTGFTSPAGSCIIATAKKDNMEYLVVILGAPEPTNDINYRDIDCKTLFEYGFLNYENLISAQKRAITFLNNYASFVIDINTILKISLGVLSALFVFTILYKKNKTKKFENSEDIFNFRCSFW